MDLYFSPLACSLAPRIALYEAGIDARFVAVDLRTQQTADGANYLTVNPLGLVPALRSADGAILTENAAILQFIAAARPEAKLAPSHGLALTRLHQWLAFIGSELHKGLFLPLLDKTAPAAAKEYALAKYRPRLDVLARHLEGREFLLEHFSVADAYLIAVLNWTAVTPLPLGDWPALQRYHTQMLQRSQVARAVNEEYELYSRAA